ncbi:hypothetical protein NN561_013550 [Cricetulus griseus]
MAAAAAARAGETRCERAGLAGCSREGPGARWGGEGAGGQLRGPPPFCGPSVWDLVGGSESLQRARDLEVDRLSSGRGDKIRGRRRALQREEEGATPKAEHEARA